MYGPYLVSEHVIACICYHAKAGYLVVLIRCDRDEGGFVKHMRAVGSVLGAKGVVLVCLHDVEPGLVLVHGVKDDLESMEKDNRATEIDALVAFVSEFGQLQNTLFEMPTCSILCFHCLFLILV